ncbi:hypothetical protein [Marinobacter bohaiensis]|uniref:hypothetical protein n=1 Tax=Marinobacter bohaiensis TaxID=2201898 RepID=UPI000DAF0854|nr:hypothetical protein [Marinobacter bohaiensis]
MSRKRFSTLDTTRLLFEHPRVLFRVIERMDRESVRYVRESELAMDVLDYVRNLKRTEQERIRTGFSTDNLFRTGLVIDIVKAEGERRLVFQEALLNLVRACNASLYQELTDARLRGHLVTLRDIHDRLTQSTFNDADPDFTELRDDLNERVSLLIGLLRQNILRMQTLSADLADMSGDASRAPEQFSHFRQDLLERIATLYERHIQPTLVFLNPDTQLPDGANLFATLEGIIRLLEQNRQQDIADQMFRSSLSLNALHKPIQTLAAEVDHFLRKTRRSMVQYNAMEHFFAQLRELKEDTETLNLKKKWLDGSDFSRTTGFLVGLKAQSRPRQYAFGQSSSYYQLLFSELDLRLADLGRKEQVPDLGRAAAAGRNPKVDAERIQTLYQWLESLQLRPTRDLVRELHGRLDGVVAGYRFPDLLAAVNRLSHKHPEGLQVVTTNRFNTLETEAGPDDIADVFVYRRRRLEPRPNAPTSQGEASHAGS